MQASLHKYYGNIIILMWLAVIFISGTVANTVGAFKTV